MRCLCCGKEIKPGIHPDEMEYEWHKRCIKEFFGTRKMPVLDVTDKQLEALADSMVNRGITVPGVQKKLSLHLSHERDARLTIVDYPTGYILKPQTEEYACLPEYEALSMRMAELCGIQTVPHALIKMKGKLVYITKRIDRVFTDDQMKMYAMEDFCQLAGRLTQDKYKGSYEACGRVIMKYSVHPGLDLSELFMRVVFSYFTGNSDMHLKNFSLIETKPGKREYELSKAYDMLPVNVILPEDLEQMALTINGKKKNIRKKDFLEFASKCNINGKAAEKMILFICQKKEKLMEACDNSYLPEECKEKTRELIASRMEMI